MKSHSFLRYRLQSRRQTIVLFSLSRAMIPVLPRFVFQVHKAELRYTDPYEPEERSI